MFKISQILRGFFVFLGFFYSVEMIKFYKLLSFHVYLIQMSFLYYY